MIFVKKRMLLFKYSLWKQFYSLIHYKLQKEKFFLKNNFALQALQRSGFAQKQFETARFNLIFFFLSEKPITMNHALSNRVYLKAALRQWLTITDFLDGFPDNLFNH
jgi:hypothetical protein